MRVIEAFTEPVRAIAASPDGRFLSAASGFELVVFNRLHGDALIRLEYAVPIHQMAFTPDGSWLAFAYTDGLFRLNTMGHAPPERISNASLSGGIAIAPDGRTLAAAWSGRRQQVPLERWELPAWRPLTGFDFWSPFRRLAFSPNGEFLAGIDNDTFELRIAVTGGLNGRHRIRYLGDGFCTFPRDSQTVVFGWETDLHVMETRNGNLLRRVTSPGEAFVDAAFVGSGRLLATVDGTPAMRLWSAETWEVVREYDWGAGALTCVTASSDGLAGVCGTDAGRLVVFDVDE
jgi:WD40 repeat protein